MPDNHSEDRSAGNPLGEPGAEEDVDALLDSAAGLAADLGGEIGTEQADHPPKPAEAHPDADQQTDGTTIDAQLDEIEALLGSAGESLGEDEAEPPAPGEGSPAQDATGTVASESAAEDLDSALCDIAPDGAGSPSLDEAGETPAVDSPPQESPAEPAAEPAGPDASAARLSSVGGARLVLIMAAHKGLDMLDWIDRPFQRVGYGARLVIGWAALATLLVAGCVFVISCFR